MKKILILFVLAATFTACRKQPDYDALTYKAIVVTNRNANIDFENYQTYFLPPFVGEISDDPLDTILDSSVGDLIIAAIDQNMQSRGYTKISSPTLADIGIGVVTITVTTVGTYYPGYWYGYGYGGYYPYYPYYPYSYTYSYTTGSLVIDLIDVKNADIANNKVNIMWTNFNTGILETSPTGKLAVDAVNQAFIQSPYIKTTN